MKRILRFGHSPLERGILSEMTTFLGSVSLVLGGGRMFFVGGSMFPGDKTYTVLEVQIQGNEVPQSAANMNNI